MSGGVDSSAAAALLVEQGHEVVGLTAHLWREGSRCCSLDDVRRAIKVAEALRIPHYVVDSVEDFTGMIVHPFVSEYEHGRTPSPCVRCNQLIKFGILLREAMRLGCTHIATGHYAKLEQRADGFHLLRGRDGEKDQSYFLHRLFQDQLRHVLLPLGDRVKADVVDYVKQKALPVPPSGESQDLCFVPADGGYAAFIEKWRPALRKPGPIVDTRGREIGRHDGFYHFTVGQREGIGVAAASRLYVKEVRADTNTVVVGERDDVTRGECVVEDVHWIGGNPAADGARCTVQLRYRHRGAGATLSPRGAGVQVTFDEPQFAVTPGQAAVFYDGDEVLGGGWIVGNG